MTMVGAKKPAGTISGCSDDGIHLVAILQNKLKTLKAFEAGVWAVRNLLKGPELWQAS
jgi:hypothetical protein